MRGGLLAGGVVLVEQPQGPGGLGGGGEARVEARERGAERPAALRGEPRAGHGSARP